MDWFERLTGLSPDAGDGSLERVFGLALAVAVSVVVALVAAARGRRTT